MEELRDKESYSSQKSTKNQKLLNPGQSYTEVHSLYDLYLNKKKSQIWRMGMVDYLNHIKSQHSKMNRKDLDSITCSYPFLPDDFFSSK